MRGKRSKTFARKLFQPVSRPDQNGEFVESAKTCGRKYRTAFWSAIRVSSCSTATWTWSPKIRFPRATSPRS